MKKCVYSVFLMLGLALWLVSCADDSMDNPTIPEEGIPSGTGNIFSLAMSIPLPEDHLHTKANEVDMGSIGEILIDSVRVVLYENNIVKYCLDLDIQLKPNGSDFVVTGNDVRNSAVYGEKVLIQTTARTFERSNYSMLVLLNPNDALREKTEEGFSFTSLATSFESQIIYRTEDKDGNPYTAPSYFLMMNSQGLVNLIPGHFYDTPEKAEKNPAYINLERVAAKVSCDYTGLSTRSTSVAPYGRFVMLLDYNNQLEAPWGDDYDIPEDCIQCPVEGCTGTFNRQTKECSAKPYLHKYDGLGLITDRVRYMVATDLTWEVDIVNKKSFWLRQLTNKAGGIEEKQGDTDRENFYAKDPNFDQSLETSELEGNFTYISSEALDPQYATTQKLYPQLSAYKYDKYWSWDKGNTQPVYILENTMTQDQQKRNVVTRAVFRAILKREQFIANGTNENPTNPEPIGDFFVFKGGSTDIENYTYNNYNKDNTTFYILRPEDVAIYAKATTTDNIHIYLREGILEAIADFKSKNTNFNWNDISANKTPATSTNLSFYKNGEIYYEVPIEHFSVSQTGKGGYGRFGVVRNNWYKLNIENMISIGAPVMPAPTSNIIESATRSDMPETRSNSNFQIRNQSIIF